MHSKLSGGRRLLTLLLAATSVLAHAESAPPAPPEVKKTVAAFVGHWKLTGTDLDPGAAAPAAVSGTMDCKSAALGAAVSCLIAAEISGTRIEAATVIGYSSDEHLVRWMEISSTGEYHDHHGKWRGDQIVFEPLTYRAGGAKMTEYFAVAFASADRMHWKATTRMLEGESQLELTGVRGGVEAR